MDRLLIEMGIRITELRRDMGLTQNELAEKAGMSGQTISTAELGKKALRPENLVKLSRALGVSTDYLLTGRRNGVDYSTITTRLEGVTQEKYDQIMRMIDLMMED